MLIFKILYSKTDHLSEYVFNLSGIYMNHCRGRWKEHYDLKMVYIARRHQRANTLKPYSQKTSQSNHTRTTALSNSMKLSHACGAPKTGGSWWRDLTECAPLEKGMTNQFSILALRTP